MAALVVVVVVLNSAETTAPAAYLAHNPYVDQGTPLSPPTPAPGFRLTDQVGRQVSLSQFRGKVVILAFNDAECQTICPLTTQAMLDAKRALGPAGAGVQLLGIDANSKSTQVEDVLSYTQLHGMTGEWDFLTGPLARLEAVWHAYGVWVDIQRGLISHIPAVYVIDPQGRMRWVHSTQNSYAAIPQLGQVLAREASQLLPGHPAVASHLSYATIRGIAPRRQVALPRTGGGTVRLGPGSAHLYLFFATWDRESTPIAGRLELLRHYAAAAEVPRSGLPPLTAVDEGSVEPSATALPAFLRTLATPLNYPVAIDTTGRVADGYEVQGQPWFVLTSPSGRIAWYQEVYSSGWPKLSDLEANVRAALAKIPSGPAGERAARTELAGSPTVLAGVHGQAGELLGDVSALRARIRSLRGYPIVLNAWASWCTSCQAEFGLLARVSAKYGKRVAFLGVDTQDSSTQDAASFLKQHYVSYPSYRAGSYGALDPIYAPGIIGLPTTFLISRQGRVVQVNDGEYDSQGTLDRQIQSYLLAR
jgi:cytochrome oxidase Cu insertion factor (SCO1/SenC/PrrC family)/thiol-disulfide isomerase/thioredoxin